MKFVLSEGITQFGNMLLLVVQVAFLIDGPYVLYVAFKEAKIAAEKGVIDEDTDFNLCELVVLLVLYVADIISLGTKIYDSILA